MKTSIKIFAIASAFLLAGCGTTEQYKMYADTQKSIAQANAMSDTARYAALAEIAKTGDSGARVAAVMSINFGAQGANGPRVQQVAPPKTFTEHALQWTSLLLPNLTQFYSISANRQIAITQSNNATALGTAQSNNATATATNTANAFANIATTTANGMTAIASKIQAPQANITLSGTGVIGAGSYSTTANPVTTTTTANPVTTTTTANPVTTTTTNPVVTAP
jgi:hypothetical protein